MPVDLYGLHARVTIELQYRTGKPVAWLTGSGDVGAGDKADVAANVERLACYTARAVEAELAKAIDGSTVETLAADVEAERLREASRTKPGDFAAIFGPTVECRVIVKPRTELVGGEKVIYFGTREECETWRDFFDQPKEVRCATGTTKPPGYDTFRTFTFIA